MNGSDITGGPSGLDEVVDICRDLIRIDSTNYGSADGPGERAAAEYVASRLAEVGVDSQIFEPEPRRANLFARVSGRTGPALLVHGHLDVVPADAAAWSIHPLSGEIVDGYLWGRGSIDMKHMVAMIVAAVRELKRNGVVPERELALAFLADEENGFTLGSRWVVERKPELVADCSEAISEIGGFSVQLRPHERIYMVETARKGVAWVRLRARGRQSHGSLTNTDSSIGKVATAVSRIAQHAWPVLTTPTSARMRAELTDLGLPDLAVDGVRLGGTVLAPVADLLTSSLRHVANPTVLSAGGAPNVVPAQAEAVVDGRFVPGHEQDFLQELADLAGPDVQVEMMDLTPADESDPAARIVASMHASLLAEDPGCRILPYSSSASTDNASFAALGIQGYGFVPLRLPSGYAFSSMFHGIDERVPVEALRFGARVLYRFLAGKQG